MTRYESGRRFEWRVRRHLEERGWFVVRSAGSRGPVDLVAIGLNPGTFGHATFLIQCKADGRISPAAKNRLIELASEYGAVPIVASREGGKIVLKNVRSGEVEK